MTHKSPTHAYDSRYTQPFNDNPRPPHSTWGIDMCTLPAHGVPKVSSLKPSRAGRYSTKVKSFLRSWSTQTSRPPTSSRNSTTASAPPSSTAAFVLLCALWYGTSALANNTGKAILMQFRYPITLTFIQFAFVAFYCLLFMSPMIRFTTLRSPTRAIINTTLPMGAFQVVGHIFASVAISRIPVSTVHTIKALSPLFTVAAYALFFGVSYTTKTYISLLPLTLGVMLACSFDMSASNLVGVLAAFGSAVVFVSQNIFFKKIMPSNNGGSGNATPKLDKLNLLLYCSSMALVLTLPVWLYCEMPMFINPAHIKHPKSGHDTPHSVVYYVIVNGLVNFAQSIIAFVILGRTSPVTYSIASLIKRVAVICIAIVWFNQAVHPIQGVGILMTFVGLYMYNNAKGDVEKGEKKMRRVVANKELILPITNSDSRDMDKPTEPQVVGTTGVALPSPYPRSASSITSHTLHQPYTIPHHQPFLNPLSATLATAGMKHHPSSNLNLRVMSPMESYPSPPHSPPSQPVPMSNYGSPGISQDRSPRLLAVS